MQRASLFCKRIGSRRFSCIGGDKAAVGCICKQSMLADTVIYAARQEPSKFGLPAFLVS